MPTTPARAKYLKRRRAKLKKLEAMGRGQYVVAVFKDDEFDYIDYCSSDEERKEYCSRCNERANFEKINRLVVPIEQTTKDQRKKIFDTVQYAANEADMAKQIINFLKGDE